MAHAMCFPFAMQAALNSPYDPIEKLLTAIGVTPCGEQLLHFYSFFSMGSHSSLYLELFSFSLPSSQNQWITMISGAFRS